MATSISPRQLIHAATATDGAADSHQRPVVAASVRSAVPPTGERLPPLLDGFETLVRAASGGLCEVWQVRERATGSVHALKRLSDGWARDDTARELLRNEAAAGLAVRSPHVVRVVRAELEGEQPVLLLEWLDGVSLEQELERVGRLEVPRAVWIARQCVSGLIDLASSGWSHGDVKPGNILLQSDGTARLIDLGFARPHAAGGTAAGRPGESLLGTPEYLAPETMVRGWLNPVSLDIYSLGVTLFRMLTGRLPFHDASVSGILRMQRQARPPRLERFDVDASDELSRLVGRLLSKQPVRRPACLRTLWREIVKIELDVLS
jgi:serine/threonine-protein kinase